MSYPFVDILRHETIKMHTSQQLQRRVQVTGTPTFQGYVTWIAQQKRIHHALARFPVAPKVDFVDAFDTELYFLELEATWRNQLIHIPSQSAYAAYIESLPTPRLGCHWYNVLFAHIAGGNTAVANTARDVLPRGWIDTSSVFQHECDPSDLRAALELEASSWTEAERRQCIDETQVAFSYVSALNRVLTDSGEAPLDL
jgi:hypothetical protein